MLPGGVELPGVPEPGEPGPAGPGLDAGPARCAWAGGSSRTDGTAGLDVITGATGSTEPLRGTQASPGHPGRSDPPNPTSPTATASTSRPDCRWPRDPRPHPHATARLTAVGSRANPPDASGSTPASQDPKAPPAGIGGSQIPAAQRHGHARGLICKWGPNRLKVFFVNILRAYGVGIATPQKVPRQAESRSGSPREPGLPSGSSALNTR